MQTLDALTTGWLAAELNEALAGVRLQRIQEINEHEFVFHLWWGSSDSTYRGRKLLLCLHPEGPFLGLVEADVALPISQPEKKLPKNKRPSTPCMVLRKYLQGARFQAVEALPGEPVLRLAWQQLDELGFLKTRELVVELMGKYSNLYLLEGESQQVLAMAHPVGLWMSSKRALMVTSTYEPPPKPEDKPLWSELTLAQWQAISSSCEPHPERWAEQLRRHSWGLHKSVLQDVAAKLPANDALGWFQELQQLAAQQVQPGLGEDLGYWTLLASASHEKPTASVHEAVVPYFIEQWERHNTQRVAGQLFQKLQAELSAVSKEAERIEATLQQSERSAAKFKIWGDALLTAYSASTLPPIEQAGPTLTLPSLTLPDEHVTISLQPAKSWSQAVQQLYRSARKASHRYQQQQLRLDKLTHRHTYLHELSYLLEQADSLGALVALKRDFQAAGLLKPEKAVKETGKKQRSSKTADDKPAEGIERYITPEGWQLWVGRSSQANGRLAGKLASPQDFWFHVQQGAGGHVLVKPPTEATSFKPQDTPPDAVLLQAAQLAAWFSPSRSSTKVPVVYTRAKYVRRIPHSWPGHVTYKQETELVVEPQAPQDLTKSLAG